MRVGVHKLPMNSPNDVSALVRLIDAGEVDPSQIVALIGKTEGNGGANDFTRGFATLSYSLALAPRLGVSPDEVAKRIAFVWPPCHSLHASGRSRSERKAPCDRNRGHSRLRARGSWNDDGGPGGRGSHARRDWWCG